MNGNVKRYEARASEGCMGEAAVVFEEREAGGWVRYDLYAAKCAELETMTGQRNHARQEKFKLQNEVVYGRAALTDIANAKPHVERRFTGPSPEDEADATVLESEFYALQEIAQISLKGTTP